MKKFRFKTAMLRTALLTCAFASSVMGAKANDFTYNGIKYSTTGTNTAEVANQGGYTSLSGFIFKRVSYHTYTGLSGAIVIPSEVSDGTNTYTVTGLAGGAFMCCPNITSVTLPSTITTIGTTTVHVEFKNNSGGTQNETYNGAGTFFHCDQLQSVNMGSCSFTSTNGAMFGMCPALTSVSLPNNLTELKEFDFLYCSGLRTIDLSNTQLRTIGRYSFHQQTAGNGPQQVYVPATLKTIGVSAFFKCDIRRITDLGNVSSVTPEMAASHPYLNEGADLGGAVYGVSHLTNVKTLGDYAFSGNYNLRAMALPSDSLFVIPQ